MMVLVSISTEGRVGAAGTVRRLRALQAAGWPQTTLSDLSGLSVHYLTNLSIDDSVEVRVRESVIDLFVRLDGFPPPNAVAESAKDAGYVEAYRWVGVDIDDPLAVPGPDEDEGLGVWV